MPHPGTPPSQADGQSPATTQGAAIRVGAKNFSENLLVAELYALALEDAGYVVERTFALNTDVLHASLTSDQLDLYPEYTGTAYLNVLKRETIFDRDAVYETVKDAYATEFNLALLESSEVNDTSCYIMLKEKAEELGIETMSDLQQKAAAVTRSTFLSSGSGTREEWKEYESIYGPFAFQDVISIDAALAYVALDNGEIDVVEALTTSPYLSSGKYHIIETDKPTFIPYYLVPVLRQEILDENPEIEEILNRVSRALDNDVIIQLVTLTDIEQVEYEDAAKDFYIEHFGG